MKKEITVEEWLKVAALSLSEIAAAISNDGKISLQEGLKVLADVITNIISAYNN